MEINIGIENEARVKISEGLKRLLADSYTLYLKTHNYHWNITGPRFRELHLMFEEQYTELATAVDDIAERIRTLGEFAPGTYKQFSELATIKEDTSIPSAEAMIKQLLHDNEAVVRTAKEIVAILDGANDEGTQGLVDGRIEVHEKTAWMLRSSLS